ncbi:MAG TPA: DUF5305 domain-containing protein [Dehalococcoidia bacterium]|nr:DUF5305 domain-containing protein [Dehalococcoidia bacterium]
MKRLFLILSSILLLISIFGVYKAFSLPSKIEAHTTLLSYENEGSFDYLVYLKPSYLFGPEPQEPPPNPKYPAEIVDGIDMSFTYKGATETSQPVEVKAVLENPSIWQKESTLVPETTRTGYFTVHFPLDIDEINELFDTIEEEIQITSSSRPVTIVASVGSGSEAFTQSLPVKLGNTIIEVDSNLSCTQSGATGEFDYLIHLKENSLFDTARLEPPVVTPASPKTAGPGEVIFSNLIDRMDATFYYDFKCDQPVTGLTEEVTITAILENPEVWSKIFVLVPHTTKSGNFSLSFPLDIDYFTEMFETIRSETGVPAESYNLTITADVHTVAQTDSGEIDEVFSQTLSSALGKGTLEWNEELVKTESGAITTSQVIPNPNKYLGLSVSAARYLSAAALGIFFFFFLFSVVLYVRFKPAESSPMEEEILHIRKKYGKRIAETINQSPVEGEKLISLGSMEDLMKIADELLKPVIHQAPSTPEEAHAYYVLDGTTRYQYLLTKDSTD